MLTRFLILLKTLGSQTGRVHVLVACLLLAAETIMGLACNDWSGFTAADRVGPDAVLVCTGAFNLNDQSGALTAIERRRANDSLNNEGTWIVGSGAYVDEYQNKTFVATQNFVVGFSRAILTRSYCLIEIYVENHGEGDLIVLSNEIAMRNDVSENSASTKSSDAVNLVAGSQDTRDAFRGDGPAFPLVQVGHQMDVSKYGLMASTDLPAEKLDILLSKERCGYYVRLLSSDVIGRLEPIPVKGIHDIVLHAGESNRIMLVFLPEPFRKVELRLATQDMEVNKRFTYLFRWRAASYDEYWPPGSAYDWGGVWDPRRLSAREAVD